MDWRRTARLYSSATSAPKRSMPWTGYYRNGDSGFLAYLHLRRDDRSSKSYVTINRAVYLSPEFLPTECTSMATLACSRTFENFWRMIRPSSAACAFPCAWWSHRGNSSLKVTIPECAETWRKRAGSQPRGCRPLCPSKRRNVGTLTTFSYSGKHRRFQISNLLTLLSAIQQC